MLGVMEVCGEDEIEADPLPDPDIVADVGRS